MTSFATREGTYAPPGAAADERNGAMQQAKSTAQEAAEDIFFGQIVINWARWFVIAAAAVLIVGTSNDTGQLVLGILPVIGLMVVNFYLHGRRLAERPANAALVSLASVLDLAVITAVVLIGVSSGGQGLASPFFVAYYPVALAFAFVRQPAVSIGYTVLALAAYTGACLLVDPELIADSGKAEILVARLVTLAAMGGLGTYFWRIQRGRAFPGGRTTATVRYLAHVLPVRTRPSAGAANPSRPGRSADRSGSAPTAELR